MRKKLAVISLLTGALLLWGCQETPEEKIVREKGSASVENYQEAAEGEAGTSLRERVEAPETYTAQAKSEDGIFTMEAEAKVEVPEADAISVYQIGAVPLTQEFIDRFTESFLGDAPIYDAYSYTVSTKSEILKELEELKGYQAAGNEDPYGYREDYKRQCQEAGEPCDEETLDAVFNLQQAIDSAQAAYEEAPETVEKKQIQPALGANDYMQGSDKAGDMFLGVAEKDGKMYQLMFTQGELDSLSAKVGVYDPENGSDWSLANNYDATEGEGLPAREQVEQWAGDREQAQKQAEQYVADLGLADFQIQGSELVMKGRDSGDLRGEQSSIIYEDGAWTFYFTRTVDGFPVTYEMNPGAAVEDMDSTIVPWPYETCVVTINREGLCQAQVSNLYEVKEAQVKDAALKSFSEIGTIFEKMIAIKNSDLASAGVKRYDLQVSRVTLGYMRIYDPGTDARSGLLVPVWDFFGKQSQDIEYEGQAYSYENAYPYNSFLTINALDGTVIDRGLGY